MLMPVHYEECVSVRLEKELCIIRSNHGYSDKKMEGGLTFPLFLYIAGHAEQTNDFCPQRKNDGGKDRRCALPGVLLQGCEDEDPTRTRLTIAHG